MSTPVMDVFEATGAYLRGHFRLTSGLHSGEYLQCAKVLAHPKHAERFGAELAAALKAIAPERVDLVLAPALGGLIIGHEVARAFDIPFYFTERDSATGNMSLRRGFEVKPGQCAMVIEDVITTGGSLREVIDLVRAAGARVLAAGSVIDRSNGRADLGVPRAALQQLDVVTYNPDHCPLCDAAIPITKPGSRKS